MSRISRHLKRRLSARRTSQQSAAKHTPVPAMFEVLEPRLFLTVTTEGDELLRSDLVRDYFNVDGTSIKVGVIANGIDSYSSSYSAGELPDMDDDDHINPDITGSGNTGTKMLEVIHDIAPGAELFFSSYGSGVDDAKDAVTYLINAGCDVIVDDICLMDQPYFELDTTWDPGTGSVQSFAGWLKDQLDSNPNIAYITGAGDFSYTNTNNGAKGFHYQATYDEGTDDYHDYEPSGYEDLTKEIRVFNNSTLNVTLQWSDAFGDSENDFSLYLYDDTGTSNLLASSDNGQTGSGCLPLEHIQWTNTSGSANFVYLRIHGDDVEDTVELELYGWGEGDSICSDDNVTTRSDAIFGHKVLSEVITIGSMTCYSMTAINGVLDSSDVDDIKGDIENNYSSQGPSTVYDYTQQTSEEVDSLDGISVDLVSTSLSSFSGATAAAAHIAGVSALLLDIDPTLCGVEVQSALQDTALDLDAYGHSEEGYDNTTGYGRFDALSAAYKVYTPGQLDLYSSDDTGQHNDDNITSDTIPTFGGYSPKNAHVILLKNDNYSNFTNNDATSFFHVSPANALQDGTYDMTFVVGESSYTIAIFEAVSNPSEALTVTIDTSNPTVSSYDVNEGESQRSNLNTFSFTFDGAMGTTVFEDALELWWWDKTAGGGSGAWVQKTEGSGYAFEITSFNYASGVATWEIDDSDLGNGHYQIRLDADDVEDIAGNGMASDYTFNTHKLVGDMNGDKIQTAADIDLLQDIRYSRITPTVLSQFSLDGDGDVDADDISTLVNSIFETYMGDANLDGIVDVNDLSILASNWGTTPNSGNSAWAYGDYTGDGTISDGDLAILGANYGLENEYFDLVDSISEFNTLFGTPV